jgi:hypothetical protein
MIHPPFTVEPGDPERVFYRVTDSETAEFRHFLSDEQAGKEQALGENTVMYRGCSVSNTYRQALRIARLFEGHDGLPRHIAEVSLAPERGDCFARTLKRKGHHTIWGHPDELAQRATRASE